MENHINTIISKDDVYSQPTVIENVIQLAQFIVFNDENVKYIKIQAYLNTTGWQLFAYLKNQGISENVKNKACSLVNDKFKFTIVPVIN